MAEARQSNMFNSGEGTIPSGSQPAGQDFSPTTSPEGLSSIAPQPGNQNFAVADGTVPPAPDDGDLASGRKRKRRGPILAAVSVLAFLVIAGAMYVLVTGTILAPRTESNTPKDVASQVTSAATKDIAPLNAQPALIALYNENTVTALYANVSPSVVEIDVVVQSTSRSGRSLTQSAQGSGFLIDTRGDIVTNNHVVQGATSVQVVFNDGRTVAAKIVSTDATDDLAVISVDPSAVSGMTPLQLADSSAVRPGQMAIAIGSPYGLTDSVTVGVISGVDRSISGSNMTGMLQTDASINPGNSGGPLLNSSGQVVGINTAIESGSVATGIGFAVPSNVVSTVVPSLTAGK
ncbi:MAG: trypsin-like peptidase domain-containing protein [Dehalococcoidia bacterium]|nr:trypsin-like peptidase domain-containing protein [Dehalococcoidia bacterium]